MLPQLDGLGVNESELESLRQSADLIRNGDGEVNAARVEAEYRLILRQLEQLELQLTNNASLEALASESITRQGETSESAADYFRRLSEQPVRIQR